MLPLAEPAPDKARWILGRVAEGLEQELRLPIDPLACDLALALNPVTPRNHGLIIARRIIQFLETLIDRVKVRLELHEGRV